MSYFEELLQDPNTVWDIVLTEHPNERITGFNRIYARYDLAVKALQTYCDKQGYELQPTEDETVFYLNDDFGWLTATIYARTLIKQ